VDAWLLFLMKEGGRIINDDGNEEGERGNETK
jgi:hypothetical protein